MSDATKAVFLSYASQDAEVARRICETLRSGGVEVWFDAEGGLEHGDEWDARSARGFGFGVWSFGLKLTDKGPA